VLRKYRDGWTPPACERVAVPPPQLAPGLRQPRDLLGPAAWIHRYDVFAALRCGRGPASLFHRRHYLSLRPRSPHLVVRHRGRARRSSAAAPVHSPEHRVARGRDPLHRRWTLGWRRRLTEALAPLRRRRRPDELFPERSRWWRPTCATSTATSPTRRAVAPTPHRCGRHLTTVSAVEIEAGRITTLRPPPFPPHSRSSPRTLPSLLATAVRPPIRRHNPRPGAGPWSILIVGGAFVLVAVMAHWAFDEMIVPLGGQPRRPRTLPAMTTPFSRSALLGRRPRPTLTRGGRPPVGTGPVLGHLDPEFLRPHGEVGDLARGNVPHGQRGSRSRCRGRAFSAWRPASQPAGASARRPTNRRFNGILRRAACEVARGGARGGRAGGVGVCRVVGRPSRSLTASWRRSVQTTACGPARLVVRCCARRDLDRRPQLGRPLLALPEIRHAVPARHRH